MSRLRVLVQIDGETVFDIDRDDAEDVWIEAHAAVADVGAHLGYVVRKPTGERDLSLSWVDAETRKECWS